MIEKGNEVNTTPLVTVVVMTYNQEQYVRDAIQGALNQTYAPLEIIISDDASTDSTWPLILNELEMYEGPNTVHPRRNAQNLGINNHFNEVMQLATGEFVVIMAGDDISLPHRVRDSVDILQQNNVAGMFSNAICINQDGHEVGLFIDGLKSTEKLNPEILLRRGGNGGCGFSMAWRQNLRDYFGSIPEQPLGEDAFIPFRCALSGGFIYSQQPLIKYRQHDENVSFWNEINNSHNSEMKMSVAKKIATHYLEMYELWRPEIEKAYEKRLISQNEYKLVRELLSERIWLQKQRLRYLSHSLGFVVAELVKQRKAYAKTGIKRAALKELSSYLSDRYPRLHKMMWWGYSRLRQLRMHQF